MEKIYLFDWMETLADVGVRETKVLTTEEHRTLLVNKLEDAGFPDERRKIISDFLSTVEHFLYPDSQRIITKLKNEGYKLGIVSDMYDLTAGIVKEKFGDFIGNFDVFVTSVDTGFAKPSPELYLAAINQFNKKLGTYVLPGQIVMVGDSVRRDIEPALRLGMQTRLIDRSCQKLRDII
jgi:HAD superfamily hydrolase (TIGR01549 family)